MALKQIIFDDKSKDIPAKQRQAVLAKYLSKVNDAISGKKVKVKISKILKDLRTKAQFVIDNANKKAFNGYYYSGYIFADGKPVDTIWNKSALNKKNPTLKEVNNA